eukprot:3878902-Pleurochrysis_carterae.AAC.4
MEHAGMWDHFLECVEAAERPWASPDADTDDYRKARAVEFFNLAGTLSNDIYKLSTELAGWVLHVLCFVVPRQILTLGDPSRQSCDASESFGAIVEKIISTNWPP